LLYSCCLVHACTGSFFGQQANVNLDYNPQKNTENLVPFSARLNSPDVRDDGTVTFRLRAPEAKNVQISGVALLTALGSSGKPVPFSKGEDGVWTLTVVRSNRICISIILMWTAYRSPTPTTLLQLYSHAALQPAGCTWKWTCVLRCRNVPHGKVTRHVYHSEVTNGGT